MATTTKRLGIVPINRGTYNANEDYYMDNIVQLNNCSYYCKVDGPVRGVEPGTENVKWGLWSGSPIVQELGNSEDKVISQKVLTDSINDLGLNIDVSKMGGYTINGDWVDVNNVITFEYIKLPTKFELKKEYILYRIIYFNNDNSFVSVSSDEKAINISNSQQKAAICVKKLDGTSFVDIPSGKDIFENIYIDVASGSYIESIDAEINSLNESLNIDLPIKVLGIPNVNPFLQKYTFPAKQSGTRVTKYGYTLYDFMCSGVVIKTTDVGEITKFYSGNTIIKEYTHANANSYETVLFDSPIKVTKENPLYMSGASWFFNQDVPALYGITTLNNSPIHIDFWPISTGKINDISKIQRIITVSPNGDADYLTIQQAVNSAKDSKDNPVQILILPGIYNEIINAFNHPNLSFVGTNKEQCIIKATKGTYGSDPLGYAGNGVISNLTIISTHDDYTYDPSTVANIKNYCIHVDNQRAVYDGQQLTIENCNLYCEQGSALGMGSHANFHVKVVNCVINVNVPDWNVRKPYGGIYMHSFDGLVNGQELTLINNVVNTNTNVGVTVSRGGTSRNPIKLNCYNNISYSTVGGHTASIDADLSSSSYGNSATTMNASNS